MKPIHRPKQFSIGEVYKDFVERLLKAHPDWWGKYERRINRKNCYIYAPDRTPTLKMSWMLYKEIVERYYHKAKEAIIQGETLRLGGNLGLIRAARIQRNFSKPKINWHETISKGLKDANGNYVRVYYTDDDYCMIEWYKFKMIPNESDYVFKPAGKNTRAGKGFKIEFANALKFDALLKYKYVYHELKRKKNAVPIHES